MRHLFKALALVALLVGPMAAQAAIKIETATVQGGVAFIKGNGAVEDTQITWEDTAVTTANKKNGGFSFFGALPDDCIGMLSDGTQFAEVQVIGCTPVTAGAPAPVPKTGQTISYASGDDGDLQIGVPSPSPRFVDHGDGTATDRLTGLMWTGDSWYGSWSGALSACNSYSVAGLDDWRLPNINEILSLFDFSRAYPPFPIGNPFWYIYVVGFLWSSTTTAVNSDEAWGVQTDYGTMLPLPKTAYVQWLCVRG